MLGDFTPYSDDTPEDEKDSYAEIHDEAEKFIQNNQNDNVTSAASSEILTNNEINTRKTDSKFQDITTRLQSKRNEKEKILYKKSKYNYKRKWKKRRFEHSINNQLKGNVIGINLRKTKSSNHFRAGENKNLLRSNNKDILKSGFPYEYYDNSAFDYDLSGNFNDIYDKTPNYFLLDEDDYGRNVAYGINDGTWRENNNEEATSEMKFQEPKFRNLNGKSHGNIETNAENPEKRFKTGRAFLTENDQQKSKANKYIDMKTEENKMENKFLNKDGILKNSHGKNTVKMHINYAKDGVKLRYKNERLTKDYFRNRDSITYKNESTIKCNGNCSSTSKASRGLENIGTPVKISCNGHEKALKNPWCKYGDNDSQINSHTNPSGISKSRKNRRKFYTLLKIAAEVQKLNKTGTATMNKVEKGDVSLHNNNLHTNRKFAIKSKSSVKEWITQGKRKTKQNNTRKEYTLLQQMLNIPVKSIVDFFRKYVIGNDDPGDLLLKDIWKLPKPALVKHSKLRNKTNSKTNKVTQRKTKNNYKISSKMFDLKTILKNRHKSKAPTRTLKAKTKEANAVTRTFLSNERKGPLKGSGSFVELINVLIDGRMLDNNRYLNDVYKKSFFPQTEKSNYFPEKNMARTRADKNQGLRKELKLPYLIPLTQNAGTRADWKNKNGLFLERAALESNVKRSHIYFPEGLTASRTNVESLPRLSETLNGRRSIESFHMPSLDENLYQDNQFQNKYRNFYHNKDMSSFQYPRNNVGEDFLEIRKPRLSPQYTVPQRNEEGSYSYLNTGRKTQKQYYRQYLTLQEAAQSAPPYTFQIYEDDHLPRGTSWNRMKPMKDRRKHGLKYQG